MYRIGWFSTGRDEAARLLLTAVHDAMRKGKIRGEIAFVFSNREQGEAVESDRFFDLVGNCGIPLVTFSSSRFQPELRQKGRTDPVAVARWRTEYDTEVLTRLEGQDASLHVLAGYMLVWSETLCQALPAVNLHPAEQGGPTGTWQEVVWQLIAAGARRTGAMMHRVTPELDKGPAVSFCTFSLRTRRFLPLWQAWEAAPTKNVPHEDEALFKEIRRQGVVRELPLIIETVRAFSDGTLAIVDGEITHRGKPLRRALCLTRAVEAELMRHGPSAEGQGAH